MSGARRRDPAAALRLPATISGDIARSGPPDLGPVRRVMEVWSEVVGDALARVAQPARISGDGTLIVHANDASWAHALTLEQRTILRRLAEHLAADAPTRIKVEVGVVVLPPETPSPPAARPISAEAERRAEEMTEDVTDPRLRAALRRAIAVSLSQRAP